MNVFSTGMNSLYTPEHVKLGVNTHLKAFGVELVDAV